ncbi:MAG: LolA family protein [Geminicoccaceae bacterium]|jgi:outer membrane lipoprotein-sorting protein
MQRDLLTRRSFATLLLAVAFSRPAAAALPPDQAEIVAQVERYFNGIRTLEASFRQTAPDGSESTGKLYIDRNRSGLRFDYDPPSKVLLVAPGDWRLVFYDGSIQQVNIIPIGETPLGFLLDQQVKLAGDVTVQAIAERSDEVDVTLIRTKEPDQGKVVLTLTREPMRLTRWAVTDAQGLTTTIAIENLRTGMELDRSLFVWRDPKLFGWPKDD